MMLGGCGAGCGGHGGGGGGGGVVGGLLLVVQAPSIKARRQGSKFQGTWKFSWQWYLPRSESRCRACANDVHP